LVEKKARKTSTPTKNIVRAMLSTDPTAEAASRARVILSMDSGYLLIYN
jgi:hypothetical protein